MASLQQHLHHLFNHLTQVYQEAGSAPALRNLPLGLPDLALTQHHPLVSDPHLMLTLTWHLPVHIGRNCLGLLFC